MGLGAIYKITCPQGLSYIGKTKGIVATRVASHKSRSSECRAIKDAFDRHGKNMTVEVLLRCSEEDLDANETHYIQMLDTIYPRGYNMRCGSHVLRGGNFALSTFVREPVVYEDEEDMLSVRDAVLNDIKNITGYDGFRPWAGVVQMSVKELNSLHSATQHCSWSGPVKGVPVSDSPETMHKRSLDEHEATMAKLKREHEATMAKLESEAKKAKLKREEKMDALMKERQLLKNLIADATELGDMDELSSLKKKLYSLAHL